MLPEGGSFAIRYGSSLITTAGAHDGFERNFTQSARDVRSARAALIGRAAMPRKPRKGHVDDDWGPDPPQSAPDDAAADEESSVPSRTARKNESERLQKLGEALVELRAAAFAKLQLPERLRDAIVEARRMTNFGARRRQLQFIGKLMRRLDESEIEAVVVALRNQ
jgi:ribosome-associated protein